MVLFVFQDQSGFPGPLNFLFMLSSSGDGSSVNGMPATIVSGRLGTLSTLPCCVIINTLLHSQCDMLLFAKGFQWPYSPKWPIYMSNALLDKCFCKNRRMANKRPTSRLPKDIAGPLPLPQPLYYPMFIEGLSAEWILTGQWLSEDCFLVFPSRS